MSKSAPPVELPTHTILVDRSGTIVDIQSQGPEGARKSSPLAGLKGSNYLTECSPPFRWIINELLARKRRLVSIVMPPPALGLNVWFAVVGVPSGNASDGGGLLIHLDLTQFAVTYDNSAASARELTPALVQEAVTKAFKMDTSTMDTSGFKKTPKENRERTFEGIDSLSPRQREVLMLLGKGKSNSEIADELSCSLNTVKRHVTAVLQKLKLPNRTRAAMLVGQLDP